jgi:hypothetical protein
MRKHKDGYIQARQMTVWIPGEAYHRATHAYKFLSEGIAQEIEAYLNIEITGQLTFRAIEFNLLEHMVKVQIDSNWIQPTRA